MANNVNPIPAAYRGATPYLCVNDATDAIKFYEEAFGAREVMKLEHPDGKVAHAELRIENAPIMLADEFPEIGFVSPQSIGGTPVIILVYVNDVDALVDQATAAGAKLIRPVENQPYGSRVGVLEDPFGHTWSFATHIEDVLPEEMNKSAEKKNSQAH
jgi:PhnB protein